MLGKPRILSLFPNSFHKFNKTRARMLDFIYHVIIKITLKSHSVEKTVKFCHYVRNVVINVTTMLWTS